MDTREKFREFISQSSNIVFFGGAGVSTESGVKDFRSRDGIYNTVHEYGVSPEEILSRSFFRKHPDVFYDFYYNYFLSADAEPNRAHKALAKLEQIGKLSCVVTQNIDGLHQAAGNRNVLELHGTTAEYFCPRCGTPFPREKVVSLRGKVPYCAECGSVIESKVVLYEDPLDERVIRKTVKAISEADMLIIGGTSLNVYPAAGFVQYYKGSRLVLINRDATPYDEYADIVIHDSIGDILSAATEGM